MSCTQNPFIHQKGSVVSSIQTVTLDLCSLCFLLRFLYFRFNVTEMNGDEEVTTCSGSEPLKDRDQDIQLAKVSNISSCQELFFKWTPDQMKSENSNKGHLKLSSSFKQFYYFTTKDIFSQFFFMC